MRANAVHIAMPKSSYSGGYLPLTRPAARNEANPVKVAFVLASLLVLILFAHCQWGTGAGQPSGYVLQELDEEIVELTDYMGRAEKILKAVPLIDGHNDLPFRLQWTNHGKIDNVNLTNLTTSYATDLTRMRVGRVGAQFWSGFVPCNADYTKRTDDVRYTLEQIDLIHRMVNTYPEHLEFARTAKDIRRIHKHKRIASLIGLEGGHQIDGSLGALRLFYDLGVRYMTLTHTCHTAWADSCTGVPVHNGLTSYGAKVILEMNRIGLMVDLSHVSHDTMRDTLRVTKAPVIFSHSSAYALCRIPRNVPDEILEQLRENDGVIMVNFYPQFVSCGAESTLEAVADHISHIAEIAGPAHIGLGSDFDGIDVVPKGLEDVTKYPALIAELLRRGFSDQEVSGIAGLNLLRVMEKVEQVAYELKHLRPFEDNIHVNKTC